MKLSCIRGYVFFARWGSRFEVGCRQCVRGRTVTQAIANLLLGWWCFPWGLLTPFFFLQNVASLLTTPPGQLDDALRLAGVNRADVEVDELGLTGEERRVIWAVLSYAARLAKHGNADRVQRTGAEIASQLSGGAITVESALAGVRAADDHDVWVAGLDADTRALLLRVVVELCRINGTLTDALIAQARAIAGELGFESTVIDGLLGPSGHTEAARPPSDDLAAARDLLGVSPDASIFEIKRRYRVLMIQYHPDHAAANGLDLQTATEMTQQVNAAYGLLMAAQRVAAA